MAIWNYPNGGGDPDGDRDEVRDGEQADEDRVQDEGDPAEVRDEDQDEDQDGGQADEAWFSLGHDYCKPHKHEKAKQRVKCLGPHQRGNTTNRRVELFTLCRVSS